MTKDGDTPLKIIAEEYKSQKEEDKDTEKASQLVACLHYLAGMCKTLNVNLGKLIAKVKKLFHNAIKFIHTHTQTFFAHTHTMILLDLHRELGRDNNGVVYTLFSRRAKDSDELGFTDGEQLTILHRSDEEQWWLAENTKGKQGLVPYTFLGPYKPINLGTLL